ncbi:MAG TPA: RDD family protein [Thermoanaerobaculia bacterium]|nr:RDD family protein [Thermoanaerobaculia bacterium]
MARQRALALALDAAIVAGAVDLVAVPALVGAFFFFPEVSLSSLGSVFFGISLLLWLCRDTRGGLSRKWLGLEIVDRNGRRPGLVRSVLRNLPLLVPGWNLYEAWRVAFGGDRPRSVDSALGLTLAART